MNGETFSASAPAISPAIRRAAADWLSRRDGGLTDEEENQFAVWLEADSRHAQAFAEASAAWEALDGVRAMRPEIGAADPDLLVHAAPERTKTSALRSRWFVTSALAAAAALVVGIFLRPTNLRREVVATVTEVAATKLGDVREITLPDGSKVHLNTDTVVETRYTADERRVTVTQGEAHFSVAPNSERPFIVTARHVAVRAVGTAFNVWLDADKIEVLVTEGKVAITTPHANASAGVASSGSDTPLAAGERAIIPTRDDQPTTDKPVVAPVAADEAERTLAWREQRLEFVSAPLTEVVAQFNRYNQHKLTIDPAATGLGDVRFGGGFRPDAQEAFVRLLEANFGVRAERRTSETILHRAN